MDVRQRWRGVFCGLLGTCTVPEKHAGIVQNSYGILACSAAYTLTVYLLMHVFLVRAGVRQVCNNIIVFLILLCDRLDYETTHIVKSNGIRLNSQSQLDYLDFAEDLVILSHTQQPMQRNIFLMWQNAQHIEG